MKTGELENGFSFLEHRDPSAFFLPYFIHYHHDNNDDDSFFFPFSILQSDRHALPFLLFGIEDKVIRK